MSLPPGILAQQLVSAFPQSILCDPDLNQALAAWLNPLTNQSMSDLVQWLQANPAIAAAAGDTLSPDGQPQTTAAPLDPALVAACRNAISGTSGWIATQQPFADIGWWVQSGVVPGSVIPQAATDRWSLTTLSPAGGLEFTAIDYDGSANRTFTLTLSNPLPRHLAVYATFQKDGAPVPPDAWTTRLPEGAPAGFETVTAKYLTLLKPATNVAAISVSPTAQTLTVTLPANADSVTFTFGGLSGQGFATVPDAPAVLVTAVLDIVVPWIVAASMTQPTDLAAWYDGLLSDTTLTADILKCGDFLVGISGVDAVMAALSAGLTGVLLGKPLKGLRHSLANELTPPPSPDYGWLDQFAPAAGWSAQLLAGYLAGGLNVHYWPATVPAPITLPLSPATTIALQVVLTPDPETGIWPYAAATATLAIFYGNGFTQTLSCTPAASERAAALTFSFGCVPAAGDISLVATISDAKGITLATGSGVTGSVPPSGTRTVHATLAVTDEPTAITAATRYVCVARLVYRDSAYIWKTDASRSTATGLQPSSGAWVSSLLALTLQGEDLCLGYAWGVANQSATDCASGTQLQNPYYVQNIGTAVPAAELRNPVCGLVSPPGLAYAPDARMAAPGLYIDTQNSRSNSAVVLRPVGFGTGPFPPATTESLGRLAAQSGTLAACVLAGERAAVINADLGVLQIVDLASTPVPDADAPIARASAGQGARIGLLDNPVAVAGLTNGAILVLEQGAARVQAFDANGNSMPIFGGAAAFSLRAVPAPVYRDMAVSGDGLIHVLGSQNGGATVADFFLDIYTADGSLLATTPGINAAKIAISTDQTLYTLDFDALNGPGGRIEPRLSVWRPRG